MSTGQTARIDRNVSQSEFRFVGKHTAIYGTGVVLSKLASFIMLPVYTHYLTPADYGILELLSTTIDLIGMIAGVGLASGIFKFHAQTDDPAGKRQILSTVALGGLVMALVTTLMGLTAAGPLSRLLFDHGDNALYLRIFFLTYFFQTLGAPALLLLRIQERSVAFVALSFAKLVASLSLNIYLVVVRQMGMEGVLLSNVLVAAAFGIGQAVFTYRHVGFSFSFARFREMSRFGAPMVIVTLSSFVLTFSDRYFLNYYHGTADVGVYSLAYKFGFVLSMLMVSPFLRVWEPRRFEVARRPGAQDVFSRMFFYMNVLMIGGATAMIALIQDVLRVMVGPGFYGAYRVVPLILAVTVLQQWATYCNFGLLYRDRTGHMAWASLTAVAVNVLLNALLIPPWGMLGAAWATLGAYVVRFAVTYTLSQAQYRIDYPWRRVGVLVGVAAGVYTARALYAPDTVGLSVAYSTLLLICAAIATFFSLSESERQIIRNLLRRVWRNPGAEEVSALP